MGDGIETWCFQHSHLRGLHLRRRRWPIRLPARAFEDDLQDELGACLLRRRAVHRPLRRPYIRGRHRRPHCVAEPRYDDCGKPLAEGLPGGPARVEVALPEALSSGDPGAAADGNHFDRYRWRQHLRCVRSVRLHADADRPSGRRKRLGASFCRGCGAHHHPEGAEASALRQEVHRSLPWIARACGEEEPGASGEQEEESAKRHPEGRPLVCEP
mmetsp:Transcript_86288/g.217439  ORF Transcript_86288/g.217439 Transcript_86288/m.217439 type:complete len:214 (+) Transcript_86288:764-1405(+)